jgi:hypothetical protein
LNKNLNSNEEEGLEERDVGVLQNYFGENEFQQKTFQKGI